MGYDVKTALFMVLFQFLFCKMLIWMLTTQKETSPLVLDIILYLLWWWCCIIRMVLQILVTGRFQSAKKSCPGTVHTKHNKSFFNAEGTSTWCDCVGQASNKFHSDLLHLLDYRSRTHVMKSEFFLLGCTHRLVVVNIQKCWRGYLGRQRALLAREARDKQLRQVGRLINLVAFKLEFTSCPQTALSSTCGRTPK